jgi:hypothetical protein
VNVRERFRRLWRSSSPPDHPLSEDERDEQRWLSADDEKGART